jgi:hypothetical protein
MPFDRQDMFSGMDALAADPGMMGGGGFMDGAAGAPPVMCRVCETTIDSVTGDALSPVDHNTVQAVQRNVTAAGAALKGGVPLVDALAPPPGGGMGMEDPLTMF